MNKTYGNIDPYTDYSVVVYARNGYGWSKNATQNTKTGEFTSEPVTDLKLNSTYPSSPLSVEWKAPTVPNGVIINYLVVVSKDGDSSFKYCVLIGCKNCNTTKILEGSSCTKADLFKEELTTAVTMDKTNGNIDPYTDYSVVVYARNSYGWGKDSSQKIKTNEYTSGPVINMSLSSNYPSSPLSVTWNQPNLTNGMITNYLLIVTQPTNSSKYCVLIGCNDCDSSNTLENSTCTNADLVVSELVTSLVLNATIGYIQPYSNYSVGILAKNGYGWSNQNRKNIKTEQYISEPVTDLNLISEFPSSPLTVKWNPPSLPNGVITYYLVVVSQINGSNSKYCFLTGCTSCNLTATLKGSTCDSAEKIVDLVQTLKLHETYGNIKPFTNYSVEVYPKNDYGWGRKAVKTKITAQYKPDQIRGINCTEDIPPNFRCAWTIPPVDYPFKYLVTVSNVMNNHKFNVTTANFTTLGSVLSIEYCRTYNFSVQMDSFYGLTYPNTFKYTTVPSTPTVSKLTAQSIHGTGFSVDWDVSGFENCMRSYEISINTTAKIISDRNYTFDKLEYETAYQVDVKPISTNSEGRQENGTMQSILTKTIAGIPESPSNFVCKNDSFKSFSCSWKRPTNARRVLIGYGIRCNITNADVTIKLGPDKTKQKFDDVFPETLYTCKIYSENARYQSSKVSFDITLPPSAMPAFTEDSAKKAFESELTGIEVTDPSTQFPIILPFSAFTERNGKIQQFTLVISVNEAAIQSIVSKQFTKNSFYEKAYTSCKDKTTNCIYEISVKPVDKKRSKRNVPSIGDSPWDNSEYLIGEDSADCSSGHSCNGPLVPGTKYIIGFRAYTSAGFVTPVRINRETEKRSIVGVVVGVLVSLVVIAVVIFLLVYFIPKRSKQPKYEPEPSEPYEVPSTHDPQACQFELYMEEYRKNNNQIGNQLYQELKAMEKHRIERRVLVYSRGDSSKDRYSNIKPYEFNRVILDNQIGVPDSQLREQTVINGSRSFEGGSSCYINASRICNSELHLDKDDFISAATKDSASQLRRVGNLCGCPGYFIATQGPIAGDQMTVTSNPNGDLESANNKESTVCDFWRMVWQEKVTLIVMVTKVMEGFVSKCAHYWPTNISEPLVFYFSIIKDSSTVDHIITVTLVAQNNHKHFVDNELTVALDYWDPFTIRHLNYTSWPDHNTPNVNEFMGFYQKYEYYRNLLCKSNPLIVHCSAGVGRTGTLMLISLVLDVVNNGNDRIRIWELFQKMRMNRFWLVQTTSQFHFIHEFILKYLTKHRLTDMLPTGIHYNPGYEDGVTISDPGISNV